MAVDLLRSCYTTEMVFSLGDRTPINVVWYFVPPGTPFIPYANPFYSTNWDQLAYFKDTFGNNVGLGEVLEPRRQWYSGLDTWRAPRVRPCGTADQWANGLAAPITEVPSDWNGNPLCCGSGAGLNSTLTLALIVEASVRGQAFLPAVGSLAFVASGLVGRGRAVSVTPLLSLLANVSTSTGRQVNGVHALALLVSAGVAKVRAVAPSGTLALQAAALTARARTAPASAVLALLATAVTGHGASRTGLPTLKLQALTVPTTGGVQGFSPGCSHVTHSPKSVKVTIAGATNGSCSDCANLNGTFTLTCPSNGACNWVGPPVTVCGGTSPIAFANLGGNTWQVSVGPMNPAFNVTLAGNWDGTSTLTLNRVASTSCNLPATCTVSPA